MAKAGSILLVEDDDVDILSITRALKELQVPQEIVIRTNGNQALSYLYDTPSLPQLVLLDLNMPLMNGFEFLYELRKEDHLRDLPVVVLSTSGSKEDIDTSFQLGVEQYFVKPIGYREYLNIFSQLSNYWQ